MHKTNCLSLHLGKNQPKNNKKDKKKKEEICTYKMLIKNPCILLFTGNKTIPDG
jgi:hypothetical protein